MKITEHMVATGEARRLKGLDTSSGSQYAYLRNKGLSDFDAQCIVFGLKHVTKDGVVKRNPPKTGKRACKNCGQVHNHMPFTDCYSEKTDGPLPDDLGQAYRDKFGDHDDEDENTAYRKAYHEEIDPYNGP